MVRLSWLVAAKDAHAIWSESRTDWRWYQRDEGYLLAARRSFSRRSFHSCTV